MHNFLCGTSIRKLFSRLLNYHNNWQNNRFVTYRGRTVGNVSCDLHLEHLNHHLKNIITGLQANEDVIYRAAKSFDAVHQICETFENMTHLSKDSGNCVRAAVPKECNDVQRIQ